MAKDKKSVYNRGEMNRTQSDAANDNAYSKIINEVKEEEHENEYLESILEEAKYFSEKEKFESLAKTFSEEEKPEIFSTKNKKIKVKTINPLEIDVSNDANTKSPTASDNSSENASQNITEVKSGGTQENISQDTKIETTINAEKIIEGNQNIIQLINNAWKDDKTTNSKGKNDNQQMNVQIADNGDVMSYQPKSRTVNVNVNSNMRDNVKEQYEEFNKNSGYRTNKSDEAKKTKKNIKNNKLGNKKTNNKKNLLGDIAGFIGMIKADSVKRKKLHNIAEYTEQGQEKQIYRQINRNVRATNINSVILFFLMIVSVIGSLALCSYASDMISHYTNAPIIFAVCNLIIVIIADILLGSTIFNGLMTLLKFKGNSDTAIAFACVTCTIQSVCALFLAYKFYYGVYYYYTAVLMICAFTNMLGKNIKYKRGGINFKFISSKNKNYTVNFIQDRRLSKQMAAGIINKNPVIAYQNESEFISDFTKLSFDSNDKSEVVSSKLAPFTVLVSIVMGVVYGMLNGDTIGGIMTAALMSVVSIPVSNLLIVNVPLRRFGRELIKKGAIISSYPAVMKFTQTNTVIADAYELYANNVKLLEIKQFNTFRFEDALFYAATALKEAKSPLVYAFSKYLNENSNKLPPQVDSWVYEDELGLVAWVNNARVIIGSREIMQKYGIALPDISYQERKTNSDIAFISFSGKLVAMLALQYTPQKSIYNEVKRAELNGINILVSTTDNNITHEKIVKDFDLSQRSIKVMTSGHTMVSRTQTLEIADKSRAYIVTRGSTASMLRVISGCMKLKNVFNIGVALQTIAVILGMIIMALLCITAAVSYVKLTYLIIYMVTWPIAIYLIHLMYKP